MFYKLVSNGIVVDVLRQLKYVQYLPLANRWVLTNYQYAQGVLGSDDNTVYLLDGRQTQYAAKELKRVAAQSITEQQYQQYQEEIGLRAKEREELNDRINSLEEIVAKQNSLLEALLEKLENL